MKLIDADALAYIVASNGDADFINKVTRLMIDAPSIDIVRCKECKCSDESLVEGCVYCNETDRAMDENGFCHKGEREGE